MDLPLIPLFSFYLGVAFLCSTLMRVRQYRTILGVVRSVPSRWPKLFELIKQHRGIFLTWRTFLPLLATLAVWIAHSLFRRLALTDSHDLTPSRLLDLWMALPLVVLSGLAMLAFDAYSTFRVGNINRQDLEKYFDQAEYWLNSWKAPVVRVFTLGYINPRKMVAVEVQSALVSASELINSSLWWTVTQTGLRLAFGVTLWLAYALSRS